MTTLLKLALVAATALTIVSGTAYADGIIPGPTPETSITPGIPPQSGSIIPSSVQGPSGGIIPGNVEGPSGGIIPGNVQGPSGGIIPGPTLYSADYSKKPGTTVGAQATGALSPLGSVSHSVSLSCTVEGGLTKLLVKNAGEQPLAAGTKLRWAVTELGAKGYLRLNKDLGAGGRFVVPMSVTGLAANSSCPADII